MPKPKGRPTPREVRSQLAQLKNHPHGNEKGVKWPMAVKDGTKEHPGSVHDTALRGEVPRRLWELQRCLDTDKNLSGYGLKASFVNNALQITGIVDTLADKVNLKQLLSGHGIYEFVDAVSISTDGQVLDEHVATEVQEELEADPRLADLGIGVQCLAGTVFLTGDIEERRQEELAVAAARRARGVTRVVSQLRYLPGNVDADAIFHSQVHNDGEQTWPWRK